MNMSFNAEKGLDMILDVEKSKEEEAESWRILITAWSSGLPTAATPRRVRMSVG
jgi:hypothetical protein